MGSLLDVDSSFFSSVALNAMGCTSGVEVAAPQQRIPATCARAGSRRGAGKAELTGGAHGASRERASAWGNDLTSGKVGSQGRGKRGARAKGTSADILAPLGRERERVSARGKKPLLTGGAHLAGGAGTQPCWAGWAGLSCFGFFLFPWIF